MLFRSTSSRLNAEQLEDRTTPTVWGNPWVDPQNLTISFAPDGTLIDSQKNSLNSLLNSQLGSSTGQIEILRAFQTWATYANINFSVVSDNGKDFGTIGALQNNPWYGDIRMGARPLSSTELAIANPFDMFNTWVGEVMLNSNQSF